MGLKELLFKKKNVILKKWLDSILKTYPADTKNFLKKQNNRFANPVGHTIATETENLLDLLIDGQDMDQERIYPVLDRIIRVRSIQDFSPSHSILIIYMLKNVVREVLENEIRDKDLLDDLLTFFTKIDQAALIAFDIYTECRETLYKIKVDQAKNQVSGLLRRTGLISELPEWDPH
ncbi:RsbRD N-terminal domain-containing protein [Deltaproteobacteria bacterium]|nr:RsbRD N-terminal domain-containing protein [Deltaproteobacteria bacterium]